MPVIEGVKKEKASTSSCYEFGPFIADEAKSVLLRNGEIVPLGLKAFEVLLALIESQGEVLKKDELLKKVWPDTVVEENNLTRTISALRKALDDHLEAPVYIATIPGRGYRFVAEVKERVKTSEILLKTSPSATNGQQTSLTAFSPALPPKQTHTDAQLRKQIRYYQLGLGGLLLLLLGGVIVMPLLSQLRARTAAPLPRKLWQLSFDPGLENEPTWSPDGRMLAYSSDRSGNFDIWVQPVSEGNPVRITTSPSHDWQADWAPEGNRLVFRSEREGGGLYVVPVLGGNEHKIASFGYRPRWSPDGTQILFYGSILRTNTAEIPKLYLVGLDGNPPREVLSGFLTEFKSFYANWHSDGQRVSLWGNHLKQGFGFWTVPLAGGKPVKSEFASAVINQLSATGVGFSSFQWDPNAEAIYFEGTASSVRNLWKVSVDPASLRWIAGPERLTTGAGTDSDLVISRDGRSLAFTSSTQQTRIWSYPFKASSGTLNGSGQPITAAGVDAYFPELSSDGRKLAFVTNRAGKREVRVKSLTDGQETVLITDDVSRSSPRWSRDGKRLAYSRENLAPSVNPQNRWDLATMSVDGSDEKVLTTGRYLVEPTWDWSSDGNFILAGFMRGEPVRRLLGRIPISGAPNAETQMQIVTSNPEENIYQARFSPDDRWISFCTARMNEAGISTIYVIPSTGGNWIRITDGKHFDDKPRWSPDGRTIYFVSNRSGYFNVWGIHFNTTTGQPEGEPFRVSAFDSPGQMILEDVRIMEMALSSERLILPMMEVTGNIWILENVRR